MTFNSINTYKGDLYYPQNEGIELYIQQQHLDKIVVCFDGGSDSIKVKLKKLSAMVKKCYSTNV